MRSVFDFGTKLLSLCISFDNSCRLSPQEQWQDFGHELRHEGNQFIMLHYLEYCRK